MNKNAMRQFLKQKRALICSARREEARLQLFSDILSTPYRSILSFASTQTEIETHALNDKLAQEGRLYLPKCVDGRLEIFHVTDTTQLKRHPLGFLEPGPSCTKVETVCSVLVPALGFDHQKNRIGYGMGYYDRLRVQLGDAIFLGCGFKEQLVDLVPTDADDQPVHRLHLY